MSTLKYARVEYIIAVALSRIKDSHRLADFSVVVEELIIRLEPDAVAGINLYSSTTNNIKRAFCYPL